MVCHYHGHVQLQWSGSMGGLSSGLRWRRSDGPPMHRCRPMFASKHSSQMSQHSSARETGLTQSLQAHSSQSVLWTDVTRSLVNLLVGLRDISGSMTRVTGERRVFLRVYASVIVGFGSGYALLHMLW